MRTVWAATTSRRPHPVTNTHTLQHSTNFLLRPAVIKPTTSGTTHNSCTAYPSKVRRASSILRLLRRRYLFSKAGPSQTFNTRISGATHGQKQTTTLQRVVYTASPGTPASNKRTPLDRSSKKEDSTQQLKTNQTPQTKQYEHGNLASPLPSQTPGESEKTQHKMPPLVHTRTERLRSPSCKTQACTVKPIQPRPINHPPAAPSRPPTPTGRKPCPPRPLPRCSPEQR